MDMPWDDLKVAFSFDGDEDALWALCGHNGGKTLFQHALEDIAKNDIRKKVDEAVKQVKAEAAAKVGKLVAEAIAAKV